MRNLLILTFLFVSCNSTVDSGNGGTSVDGKYSNSFIDRPSLTLPPIYTTYSENNSNHSNFKFKIKAARSIDVLKVIGVKIGDFNIKGIDSSFHFDSNTYTFNVSTDSPSLLTNLKINFEGLVVARSIQEVKIFSTDNGEKILYKAENLSDTRAKIYLNTKDINFNTTPNVCPSKTPLTDTGECRRSYVICSDVLLGNCEIKRDDGQTVLCYATSTNLAQCSDKTDIICNEVSDFIEYDKQMFWTQLGDTLLRSVQCDL